MKIDTDSEKPNAMQYVYLIVSLFSSISDKCEEINQEVTEIKDFEHVGVECREKRTSSMVYAEGFSLVQEKQPPKTEDQDNDGEMLNVMMIGMDATSQLNFMRKMPLSFDYLVNELAGVVLRGHNKVGECTHSNIFPILTGLPIQKFRESCVEPQIRANVPIKLDDCYLLWKEFAQRGYLTTYGEDFSAGGAFHYYFPKSFRRAPTHYYLRPAALYSETLGDYYTQDYSCLGPSPGFQVLMDFAMMNSVVNEKSRWFQFMWPGSLGYKDLNNQQRGDQVLVETLKYWKAKNILNKTALFIVGDHGFRKKGYKYTHHGAIEDRMPISMVILPRWFESSYPTFYSNLVENAEKMTSQFDTHKTIKHILYLNQANQEDVEDNTPFNPGTSLFHRVPEDRTCLQAGIPLYWCMPCHPRQPVESQIQNVVANFLLSKLNSGRHICFPKDFTSGNFSLLTIRNSSQWDRRDVKRELCDPTGKGVQLLGFYGQPNLMLSIPCNEFHYENIQIIQVAFETNAKEAWFTGEVVWYEKPDSEILLHLTEDVQFNYRSD